MLRKIVFHNFKSFVDETIIDLTPGRIEYLSDSNIENGVLKGCAFYGANASGKTGALMSVTLLLDLLFKNGVIINNTFFSLFTTEKKMSFEYTFSIDGHEVVYFFECDKNKGFTMEKLSQDGESLLDRTLTSAKSYITENQDYQDIDPGSLFIRSIYFNTRFAGRPVLLKWFAFLKGSIFYDPLRTFNQMVSFDPKTAKDIYLESYLEANGTDEINDFLEEYNFPFAIDYTAVNKQNPIAGLTPFQMRLRVTRKDLEAVPFYLESAGNQIFLSFLPPYLSVLKTGGILAIDEFSSGFHNDLEELLIRHFFRKAKGAQIIFVSHSTNLLKTSLLRPDQVYSTDFNNRGSYLTKFSQYGMRESQNMEKMYLAGAFGGIPAYGSEPKE